MYTSVCLGCDMCVFEGCDMCMCGVCVYIGMYVWDVLCVYVCASMCTSHGGKMHLLALSSVPTICL